MSLLWLQRTIHNAVPPNRQHKYIVNHRNSEHMLAKECYIKHFYSFESIIVYCDVSFFFRFAFWIQLLDSTNWSIDILKIAPTTVDRTSFVQPWPCREMSKMCSVSELDGQTHVQWYAWTMWSARMSSVLRRKFTCRLLLLRFFLMRSLSDPGRLDWPQIRSSQRSIIIIIIMCVLANRIGRYLCRVPVKPWHALSLVVRNAVTVVTADCRPQWSWCLQ